MNPRRILAVANKETRELLRDPITMGVCLLIPLVMLFLFGYAVSLDVEDVALGVLDRDRTPASRELVDRFTRSGYFHLERSTGSASELTDMLQRGRVLVALVIPHDFQRRLVRREGAEVQVLVDGTYSATALVAANYAKAIVAGYDADEGAIRAETRVWYNPALRSVNYIVPGLYGVILMAFPPLLTALAIVREKETGTIAQIFASPVTGAEFISGKLIPYSVIAFGQMVLVIVTGYLWFGVPFAGSLGFLLGTALIYVMGTVGIGLLVSTMTRSQVAAMLLALILTLMPSFLFSGMLFPIFTMPYVLQLYTMVFPVRYFVEISRGVVLKGVGPPELWVNVGVLTAYAVAMFGLAVWRFRKKVA